MAARSLSVPSQSSVAQETATSLANKWPSEGMRNAMSDERTPVEPEVM